MRSPFARYNRSIGFLQHTAGWLLDAHVNLIAQNFASQVSRQQVGKFDCFRLASHGYNFCRETRGIFCEAKWLLRRQFGA